jgi:hypothetical protein
MKTNLATLPADHPLRNKPMREINATIRQASSTQPGKPFASWKIAECTFNELAPFWFKCNVFEVEEE